MVTSYATARQSLRRRVARDGQREFYQGVRYIWQRFDCGGTVHAPSEFPSRRRNRGSLGRLDTNWRHALLYCGDARYLGAGPGTLLPAASRADSAWSNHATAAGLSSAVRALAEAAIRTDDPEAPVNVVRARLARRLYGPEVAVRLFPGVGLYGG
jgi:hypothetical protein